MIGTWITFEQRLVVAKAEIAALKACIIDKNIQIEFHKKTQIEVNELKAHIERLREVLQIASNELEQWNLQTSDPETNKILQKIVAVLGSDSKQSLAHIQADARKEFAEWCKKRGTGFKGYSVANVLCDYNTEQLRGK